MGSVGQASDAGHQHPWPLALQCDSMDPLVATTTTVGVAGANDIMLSPGFVHAIQVLKLVVDCATLHNAANYCFGLYNLSGQLLLSTGAIAFPATGVITTSALKMGDGSTAIPANGLLIPAGVYLFAHTASATTAKFNGGGVPPAAGMKRRWGKITGGGTTLPVSIDPTTITDDAVAKPWIGLMSV